MPTNVRKPSTVFHFDEETSNLRGRKLMFAFSPYLLNSSQKMWLLQTGLWSKTIKPTYMKRQIVYKSRVPMTNLCQQTFFLGGGVGTEFFFSKIHFLSFQQSIPYSSFKMLFSLILFVIYCYKMVVLYEPFVAWASARFSLCTTG